MQGRPLTVRMGERQKLLLRSSCASRLLAFCWSSYTQGRNIRLCEIRSEAFSIGALWCLWSSTIQNRKRIEFPEIWKASTDTFSITPPPKARLNHGTYRSEDWEWVNSFLRAFKPKITLFKKILLIWMNWTKMVLHVHHKQTLEVQPKKRKQNKTKQNKMKQNLTDIKSKWTSTKSTKQGKM